MNDARHLRPGLRYVFTSGACATFAAALVQMPALVDAAIIEMVDRHDRNHIVVQMADGRFADAEGIRTRKEIARSFGFAHPVTEVPMTTPPGGNHVDALAALLLALGWADGPPDYDPNDDIAGREAFEAAKDDFAAVGGWNGDPVDMLNAERRRILRAAARRRSRNAAIGEDDHQRRPMASVTCLAA